MTAMRLQRYLSRAGIAARRKAELLIAEGAVTVNGRVVTEMGTKVEPRVDRVCVHGQAVYPEETFYILFNKPKGCITAVSDPEGRMTVMDYLRNMPSSVTPVGRLDYYSEGVLLLTNDGELAAKLLGSAQDVEKTYHVKVQGHVTDSDLESMRQGMRLDLRTRTKPAEVDRLRAKSRHDWLVITLTEGKSRQIHRMLEALGHTVLKIQRVAFAGLTFHGLRVGDARELTQVEVNGLRELVGLSKDTVSRGKWSCKREDTELGRRAKLRQARELEAAQDTPGDEHEAPRTRAPGKPRPSTSRGAGPRVREDRPRGRSPGRAPAAYADRRPERGPGRPARSDQRPERGPGRPARSDQRPERGPGRPARSDQRPERGPGRPARSPDTARGGSETRAPRPGAARGPSRKPGSPSAARGPSRKPGGPRAAGPKSRPPGRGPKSGGNKSRR